MTIALKIGNEDSQVQGFIYLDAVTRYDKDLSGKVTSFPVDSGANISDHFIANNPKFTIEGVVSDVDITGGSALVSLNGEKPLNSRNSPPSTSGNRLLCFKISANNSINSLILPAKCLSNFLASIEALLFHSQWKSNTPVREGFLRNKLAPRTVSNMRRAPQLRETVWVKSFAMDIRVGFAVRTIQDVDWADYVTVNGNSIPLSQQ